MPFRIYASPHLRLMVVTFHGTVTAQEISTAFQNVPDTEGWEPGFDTFWDCRKIDKLEFEPSCLAPVTEVGKAATRKYGPGRGAIVTPRELDRDIAQLLLIRMQDGLRERRLFSDLDAAATWLGLDPGAIAPPS
ncbi:MAG TPA: hypothetical protein VFG50_00160 [Rhodothermales bacterium]|nr:hypothetical protein [Rhodothermales bacterium]